MRDAPVRQGRGLRGRSGRGSCNRVCGSVPLLLPPRPLLLLWACPLSTVAGVA